jgi:D-alanyl-D-alanine carboxypeptidase
MILETCARSGPDLEDPLTRRRHAKRMPCLSSTSRYRPVLLGSRRPVPRADTNFRAASNTKTMTAALIMQLAQENKLTLDDRVSKYVPRVPKGDHITIAAVLEMRSGLYNYSNAPAI